MTQQQKRIGMSLAGVLITGFCVGTFQKAALGTDPFTCFVTGIANLFHSTYSTFYLLLTGALLAVVFLVDRHYIGLATIFNLLGTGFAADLMRGFLDGWFPNPSLWTRGIMMAVGLLGACCSASLYFTADLGVSAYDAQSLIAAQKLKRVPFKLCRIATDCLCVLVGLLFHANVGIGTVITALCMGPMVQWFHTHLSEPLLYGAPLPPESR